MVPSVSDCSQNTSISEIIKVDRNSEWPCLSEVPRPAQDQWFARKNQHIRNSIRFTTYYSERIQSKVSKEKRRVGQTPVQTKAKQRQLLEAEKSSELSAISKGCRQKLEFRAAKCPERRELQRYDRNIQQFFPDSCDKFLNYMVQEAKKYHKPESSNTNKTENQWATKIFYQSCGPEKRSFINCDLWRAAA